MLDQIDIPVLILLEINSMSDSIIPDLGENLIPYETSTLYSKTGPFVHIENYKSQGRI